MKSADNELDRCYFSFDVHIGLSRSHWRIQDFRLGDREGQVERRRREYRGAAGADGVGWAQLPPQTHPHCVPSPEIFWIFFASEW